MRKTLLFLLVVGLFAPIFVATSSTKQCQIGQTTVTIQGNKCPSTDNVFRIYDGRAARECTEEIRNSSEQEGSSFFSPRSGTGYCEVDLGAKKDPRAFITFMNDVFPRKNITTLKDAQDNFEAFEKRVAGGTITQEQWENIEDSMQKLQTECEDFAKEDSVNRSCVTTDFGALKNILKNSGYASDSATKLAMFFTHPKKGAYNTTTALDMNQEEVTKEHIVLDYSTSLDLTGIELTDSTVPPGNKRGRATFDTHYAKKLILKDAKLKGVTFHIKTAGSLDMESAELLPLITKTGPKLVTFGQFKEDDGRGNLDRFKDPMTVTGDANFKNVKAPQMFMDRVDFQGKVSFENAKANGINMHGVNFRFDNRGAPKVNFKGAKMEGAIFSGLNSKYQDQYLQFKRTHSPVFPESHSKKFDFTKADLTKSDFKGAFLYHGTIFKQTKLFKADFSNAYLEAADFTSANGQFANFQGAMLEKAIFKNANLRHTNVEGADLKKADFSDADIRGMKGLKKATNIGTANWKGAKCWPEQYLMLQNKGVAPDKLCSIEDRCRYVGSPTFIQTKPSQACQDYEKDEDGNDDKEKPASYCYAVVRCSTKEVPPVSFRAFCSAKNGKCPYPGVCAEENLPKGYEVFKSKEEKTLQDADGSEGTTTAGKSGSAR